MSGVQQFTYQWFVDDVAVLNETSSTYLTSFGDVDKEIGVEVSFIDDAGHLELVSDTAFVTQSVNVSGPQQTYTLIPFYEDFVWGSSGADTLTLVGQAENLDFIDLGDGIDTVEGVEFVVGGTSNDTVLIEGELSSLNGIIVNSLVDNQGTLTNQIESVINDGYIEIFGETTVSTGGNFTNNGGLVLDSSHITFDSFSTQNGNVKLNGSESFGSSLTITNGSLTNHGHFSSTNSQPNGIAPNEFSGDLVNGSTGVIHAFQDLTFLPGSSLDVRQGFIGLSDGVILRFDGATLMVDSDSPIFSAGGASLELDGVSTLAITGSYNISSVGPILHFAGLVNVTGGTLTVERGAQLELTGDDIDAMLTNDGFIFVTSGTTTLDGGFSQTSSGQLVIDSTSPSPAGIGVTGTFTNAGLIVLENSDSSGVSSTLTVDVLANASEGQIVISNNSTGTGSHIVNAQLINNGEVYIFTEIKGLPTTQISAKSFCCRTQSSPSSREGSSTNRTVRLSVKGSLI